MADSHIYLCMYTHIQMHIHIYTCMECLGRLFIHGADSDLWTSAERRLRLFLLPSTCPKSAERPAPPTLTSVQGAKHTSRIAWNVERHRFQIHKAVKKPEFSEKCTLSLCVLFLQALCVHVGGLPRITSLLVGVDLEHLPA